MLCAPCSGLVLLLILRGTNGDSVTQTEGPVILPEGAPLTLNCTYQSSYSVFLFWYVQYQNKEPELLLKSSSENQEEDSRGFQAKLVTSDSSFHLQKASVQVSDSAVYYCALRDTVRGTIGGAEHKPRGCRWAW
uniref:Ig-like domain-containing protein n=1 Tax=Equus asinus TaxID=9793 RepID=A0A8C4LW86_EQUAS